LELLHERCAGLDVHKDTVVACARTGSGTRIRRETETFGTTTDELLRLHAWLLEREVTQVGMEATGVYWKPVWYLLEDGLQLILANPMHIKAVPGRKTDVRDCEWIAELVAHGLITSSFVPPAPIHELRTLTRSRKQLSQERTRHVQRVQKTLQDANIKIDSFISDIMGKSGRAFVEAIIAGETDPTVLAALGDRRLKATPAELRAALKGRVRDHHRFMLRTYLDLADGLERAMAGIDAEVAALLEPFRSQVALLKTLPGIAEDMAEVLLAEIGADMTRFPTAEHLVSWARLSPRSDQSAGKSRSTRILKGAKWLKQGLIQSAWSAVRDKKKGRRFASLFTRIKGRADAKRAIVAVAARLLRTAWYVLKNNVPYADVADPAVDDETRHRQAERLLARVRRLGFNATLSAIAPATA
jgi:transposase